MNILFAIYTLLLLLQRIIFADIILSWLTLFGLNIRPRFIADIIEPMYDKIRSFLPTSIGPIDFTPIVIIMIIYFITGLLNLFFPGSYDSFRAFF